MKLGFRILGIVLGLIFMAGFGLCGLLGLSYGAMSADRMNGTTFMGVVGIAIALVIGWLIVLPLFKNKPKQGE